MDQVQHWFKQLHQLWHKVTRTMIGMVGNTTLPREMGQLRPHLVTWEGFWCPHKLYNGCLLIKVLMPCFTLQWVAPNETFYWSLLSFSFHPKSVRIDLPNCSSQPSMVHWLSSSIFPCLVGCSSRYGDTRPNLTSSCPTPPNPYIF